MESNAKVLILGNRLPANYGPVYTDGFFEIFTAVADNTGASVIPDFLIAINGDQTLFQDEGIHPTAMAQPLILETVLPVVIDLLDI